MPAIAPNDAADLGGAQIIDVRPEEERAAGHVAGDRHIRLDRLTSDTAELSRERPVVFYCRSGERSSLAADAFVASGWEAHHLDGGLLAWVDAGLPLDPPDGRVAERTGLPGA